MATNVSASIGVVDQEGLGIFAPRYWLGETVEVFGKLVNDRGAAIQGQGTEFFFQQGLFFVEEPGVWNEELSRWECRWDPPTAGDWIVGFVCLKPERQTRQLGFTVVPIPGGVAV